MHHELTHVSAPPGLMAASAIGWYFGSVAMAAFGAIALAAGLGSLTTGGRVFWASLIVGLAYGGFGLATYPSIAICISSGSSSSASWPSSAVFARCGGAPLSRARRFSNHPMAVVCFLALWAWQASVPVEREPMHRVVFENALVRVIDAAVPAGTATLYHTHARDNVPVALLSGRTATTLLGGTPVESTVTIGRVTYARGGYTHEVRNVGSTALRFIDVELVGPRAPATGAVIATSPAGHWLEIDNERVRVHRVTVGPGQMVPDHRHEGPILEVIVRGDSVTRDDVPGPVTSGAFAWRDDGGVPVIRNTGPGDFEIVEVEWKP
jgi:mannose-6-phosphate isomerase-like protein (cupin superfamily)